MKRLDNYENYMVAIKGRSESSVDIYSSAIREFLEFCFDHDPSDEELGNLTKEDACNFIAHCTRKGNNAKTRARKVSSIRGFFLYLDNECGIKNDVYNIDKPKTEKTLPKYLTLDQTKKLLSSIDNKRDYCIFTIFLNCGLRLNELSNIKVNDIRDNGTLVVYGKGAKERTIYLNDVCINAINEYLDERNSDNERLFEMTRRGIQDMVKRRLVNAGLGEYSCHKLRHTCATMYYQYCDADILELKEMLGHENVSTTQIYTHVTDDQLKSLANSSPLNNVITLAS